MRKNEEFNDWIDKNQKRIFEANKRIRQKYTKVRIPQDLKYFCKNI